ncbi:MAG: diacylglycerol kinase family lipid kinase [Euzebyales bacterium]|nr:diacylglycerol kinase family lipid kinase [Euzebyales bacterium]
MPTAGAAAFGPMRLVVNPRAGRGAVARNLPTLTGALRQRGLDFDVVETTVAGGTAAVTRRALDEGVRYLVAVGGDGTVHEVVNGMFERSSSGGGEGRPAVRPVVDGVVLGVAGAGSGCDFIRTFGLDREPVVIARHLATDATMDIDVGVADYRDAQGRPARRLFANIAQVGYGAEVVRRAARYPRFLGRVRYLLGAYAAIATLHRQETEVVVAHTSTTLPVVDLVVANGQFFGGGMKVAPRALPDDGRFNIQVFTGERSQVFVMTSAIYRGEHLPHPNIVEYQSPTVQLAPADPLPVEADGEVLGTTPAAFSLLRRVLRLKI